MRSTWTVGRVGGIPIRVDWSVVVVLWLVVWLLAADALPVLAPGYATGWYWVAASVTGVAFVGSLLAHEMTHAVVAGHRGVRVASITLWLLGGVAALEDEPATPRDDFAVAVAGPLASFAAAAGSFVVAVALQAAGAPELAVAVPVWLATINVVLGVFNLAPAAPLDGGRVLRAALWHRRGDRLSAAVSAARAGRTFGYVLVGLGLLEVATGFAGGLWLVLLGWFLVNAARSEQEATVFRAKVAGLVVADAMTPEPVVAPAATTVDELLAHHVARLRCSSVPLVGLDGSVVGLVTPSVLDAVPPDRRPTTRADAVAWPVADVTCTTPAEPLFDLAARLGRAGEGRALVFDGGLLVGIVTPSDVARAARTGARRHEVGSQGLGAPGRDASAA